MKLKTIFCEYEMPNEFWDRLEKIFQIETKEAYERGLKSSSQQVNHFGSNIQDAVKLQPADTFSVKNAHHDVQEKEDIVHSNEQQIKKEIDKDYDN